MRTSTPSGTCSTVGREVQDARDAGGDQPVADLLRGRAGVAMTPIATCAGRGRLLELVDVPDDQPGDRPRRPGGVGVEQRRDAEAAGGEAAVVGQRVPEVADADDDDRPVLGQAELAGDLVATRYSTS